MSQIFADAGQAITLICVNRRNLRMYYFPTFTCAFQQL